LQKPNIRRRFWAKTTKTITGEKISVTGKLRKITGKKYSIRQFRREPRTNRFPLYKTAQILGGSSQRNDAQSAFNMPELPPPLDPPSR
jgi:hypothetical protein